MMTKLDNLIAQLMNVLARGRDHSAKNKTQAALRCYSIAGQLTVEIKRAEVIRASEWLKSSGLTAARPLCIAKLSGAGVPTPTPPTPTIQRRFL